MAERPVEAVEVAPVKEPPPESQAFAWTRRSILAAFWVVIVAFGLPHWIWTTSTYRAGLPYELMNHWADGKV